MSHKTLQAYVSESTIKRIENQPERKVHDISISKTVGILVKEALDAREAAKNKKTK